MKIGIDATLLREDRITGVERYTINLIRSLIEVDDNNQYFVFFRKRYPSQLADLVPRLEVFVSPIKNRVVTDQLWLLYIAKKLKLDILHCPAFPSPLFYKGKTVLTIHDATLWKYPETRSKGGQFYYSPLFPQAIRKSSKIITVSRNSKKDLIHYLNVPDSLITVIYEGIDNSFAGRNLQQSSEVKIKYNLPGRYILTVGTLEPRKNLNMLIKGFEIFLKKYDTDHKLVIVGRKGWQKSLNIAKELKSYVVLTDFVDEEHLPAIYRLADLFVFPSIYEGFGFPILEAMASQTPVVASNTSSLPEVGGYACLYADPYDPLDFAKKISIILNDKRLYDGLIKKGRERIKRFSWRKTAENTLKVYEEVFKECK